jgi:hypothetical protein
MKRSSQFILSLNTVLAMAFISSSLLLSWFALGIARGGGVVAASAPDVSPSLQDILNKAHQAPLYTYPTSLTQGIIPVCISKP